MVKEIKKDIYWVGTIEWLLKHFHSHELSIHRGTTYNAYLILDDKPTLIDMVKNTHIDDLIKNIESIISIEKLEYLVVNHAEPDHSGAFPVLISKNPKLKVVCSKGGEVSIRRHYPMVKELIVVKTGDEMKIGKRTLKFFEAQMLHWPDTMFTYCVDDKVIFTNDAFGQHYAHCNRFVDEADESEVWEEAIKYFANILTPFSGQIIKKINELLSFNWDIQMICPSHGAIWRKDINKIIQKYLEWSSGNTPASVVVIYDSIWNGTEKMAKAICEGIEQEKLPYKLFSAATSDLNDVMTEILKCRGIIVGCPTLNNNIMPSIAPYLEEIRGLRFPKKVGAAFGTYGWSGEGVKRIEESLEKSNIKVIQPGLKIQFAPSTQEDINKCIEFGRNFAKQIKEIVNSEKQ